MYALKGNLIWTEESGCFRVLENGYLLINDGCIDAVSSEPFAGVRTEDFGSRLIIPGLYDLHIHAPQYMFAGLFMDDELLVWLDKHTFPLEARFSDIIFAEKAYRAFVNDLKYSFTARASVFGTIHKDSTLFLMSLMEEAGLHGYVGKVSMDRNSPDSLRETTADAIEDELGFLDKAPEYRNVKPIVTPRFIPSCTDELLLALGKVAKERDLPVQTHLDENPGEIEWVKELLPDSKSYAEAYESFGLLDTKTIMAHSVWITEEEMDILQSHGAYIAHSPSSNMNLSSGIAPVRRFMDRGINTGLATDTAGGSSLSMFRMITDAITSSKLRWRLVDNSLAPLKFSEAFYLASKGGGSFFGKAGSFEEGYAADILVLDDVSSEMTVLAPELSLPEKLEFYAYRAPDRRPVAKYVAGKRIV